MARAVYSFLLFQIISLPPVQPLFFSLSSRHGKSLSCQSFRHLFFCLTLDPSSKNSPSTPAMLDPHSPRTTVAMAMAAASEQVGEPEMVSLPATPRGPSTPEPRGTPARRVVDGLRGYLEEVGHLTRLDPRDAWLPVTESRGGNACYAAFHSLNAGLGFQALLLPLAFPALGWSANAITSSTPLFFILPLPNHELCFLLSVLCPSSTSLIFPHLQICIREIMFILKIKTFSSEHSVYILISILTWSKRRTRGFINS
jgi:hypothetical protein